MDMSVKVADSLAIWHEAVLTKKLELLHQIIHPDATFRSPVVHSPYGGRDALVLALSTVVNVFEDFKYHREFVSEDGQNVTLEFSAHVNGKQLKGVDLIKFDNDGVIVEFEVMIRPASGLMALGEEMGKRIGGEMKKFA